MLGVDKEWSVCADHFMIVCPKCGHEAFWLEPTKKVAGHYECFEFDCNCGWKSETPP